MDFYALGQSDALRAFVKEALTPSEYLLRSGDAVNKMTSLTDTEPSPASHRSPVLRTPDQALAKVPRIQEFIARMKARAEGINAKLQLDPDNEHLQMLSQKAQWARAGANNELYAAPHLKPALGLAPTPKPAAGVVRRKLPVPQ